MPDTTTTTTTTTGQSYEHKLQAGFISLLGQRPYFSSGGAGHGTAMFHFMDNKTEDRPAKYIVIHCAPCEPIAPGFPHSKIPVKLVCLTHIPADKDRAICNTLYRECFDLIRTMTKSTLGTAAGLTIDGIVRQGGDETFEPVKDYQMMLAACDIFITET